MTKSFLEHSPDEIRQRCLGRMLVAHEAEDWLVYSYWSGYLRGWSGSDKDVFPSRRAMIYHVEWTKGYDDGAGDRESIFPSGLTDLG